MVLREDGKLMSFAFPRFFNYHEKECDEVDIENADILEKLDGSLISVWNDGSDWRVTTRGAFPPAEQGVDFNVLFRRLFTRFDLLSKGYTYIFELISKDNRIVTNYEEEFVTFIGMTVLDTMQEVSQNSLDMMGKELGVRRPRRFTATDIDSCRVLFEQMKDDEEGLVVVDGNANRFKLKQESYLKMARIMKLKDQDILDYLVGKVELDADFDKLPEVKERIEMVQKRYNKFKEMVFQTYEGIKDLETQKDFALKAVNFLFSGILFKLRKGIEFTELDLKYKMIDETFLKYVKND